MQTIIKSSLSSNLSSKINTMLNCIKGLISERGENLFPKDMSLTIERNCSSPTCINSQAIGMIISERRNVWDFKVAGGSHDGKPVKVFFLDTQLLGNNDTLVDTAWGWDMAEFLDGNGPLRIKFCLDSKAITRIQDLLIHETGIFRLDLELLRAASNFDVMPYALKKWQQTFTAPPLFVTPSQVH